MMSSGENCWSLVTVDDYFMMALQIPPPKVTILLEEALGIVQKCSVCGIGDSQKTFHGDESVTNTVQMVINSLEFIGLWE